VGGAGECPEFFETPLDGDKRNTRWVFYGGNAQYLVGRFDGRTFTPETPSLRFNYGNCFYASQTFNNLPPEDGRRIQIAWGTVGMPGMPFNQMMDFPVELTLRTTPDGPRLFAVPVREISLLHGKAHTWRDRPLREGENLLAGITGDLFHISAELQVGETGGVSFVVRGLPLTYDAAAQTLSCRGMSASLKPVNGLLRLQLVVDRTSIEVFANDGAVYMPVGVIPSAQNRSLELQVRGGAARVKSLEVYELRSAWR
jgi:sucrose-6-phosphate hydrolase SacC (GH32 family)